jgi:hypothetical protein
MRTAIDANRGKLGTKARFLTVALMTLIVGASVLGAYLMLHVFASGG